MSTSVGTKDFSLFLISRQFLLGKSSTSPRDEILGWAKSGNFTGRIHVEYFLEKIEGLCDLRFFFDLCNAIVMPLKM